MTIVEYFKITNGGISNIPDILKRKILEVTDVLISLIWSLHAVCMNWDAALCPMDVCNLYVSMILNQGKKNRVDDISAWEQSPKETFQLAVAAWKKNSLSFPVKCLIPRGSTGILMRWGASAMNFP